MKANALNIFNSRHLYSQNYIKYFASLRNIEYPFPTAWIFMIDDPCINIISKFSGTPCPPLHVPINGALACDDMSFGTVCAPQCQSGLAPFYPEDIRPVREYFCTLQGEWRPSHAYVPDCSSKLCTHTPVGTLLWH